ncbi:hypothetical protein PVAND_008852 [Polypedilum vanderplanki]|uniref:Uncharacterized protein n=1 Tax=Polypedilum vanderplanki TaxID=319348 RepID=A0A9J6CAW4_POLVA|nr:hypothetical protein PVAND_008852 [Polypedilum vanderplanki]
MAIRNNNEVIEHRINFEEIPLNALRKRTREKLSVLLNPEKVLRSEDGYCRDWRGLFSFSGLSQSEYTLISQSHDKMSTLLDLWIRKNSENDHKVNLSQLQQCFELIDRYDIYDDTLSLLSDDAQAFLSKSQSINLENRSKFEVLKAEPDNDIITIRDVEYIEKGLSLPIYDALVIYSDKDIEFASELIERLEKVGFLLCAKDRDLLPGLSFESDAMLNLLSKRCKKLIVIISKAFLQSPMQIFMTNFAQALGIENKQRKIIPCLLEPCDLPQMLRYCFRLDYYRNNKLFDFWEKLEVSLKEHKREIKIEAIEKSKLHTHTEEPPSIYKFSESVSTDIPKKEIKQQFIPLPKLRSSSSAVNLDTIGNGSELKYKNKHSQSTLWLNGTTETNEAQSMESSVKLKRKKWYSMFLPPKEKFKTKINDEFPEEEEQKLKEKKEKKPKKLWFESKKKRDKQKEKVAAFAI